MRFLDWFRRRSRDEDLQDEIRAHLTMAERDRVAAGADPEAARLASLREFGNVLLVREATRRSWRSDGRERLIDLVQDVRYATRVLRRSPGYSLVVVAVFAIGLGANVAVFSLFKSLALNPLPGVDRSGSLAVVLGRTSAGRLLPLPHPDFRDLLAEQRSFDAIAGTMSSAFSLGIGANSRRVQGELVTGNYFQVLGASAQLGRTLLPSDDVAPGQHPVVVISDQLWKRSFSADPGIVGTAIKVNAQPMTIVGVADPAFHGTIVSWVMDLFMPVMMQASLQGTDVLSARQTPLLWGLGRLKPGASVASAGREADVLSARLAGEHPEFAVERRATVVPLWQSPFGAQTYMLPLVALLGAMGILLLTIVCANASNLTLVRNVSRRGEIAARLALGASRTRILRLLLVENLVLAMPGTLLGLAVAQGRLSAIDIRRFVPPIATVSVSLDTSFDWTVMTFAGIVALGSAVLFGVVPAWRTARLDFARVMKDDLSPRGGSRGRLRGVLVVLQVAVSLLLLVCAALILRSLDAAKAADPGFDTTNVAIVSLDVVPRRL
jgi:predicted permease